MTNANGSREVPAGEAGRDGEAFRPGWHNAIPASFNDLIAGLAGIALVGLIGWLALVGVEAARVTITAGFTLWLGWAIRGRVEAAKNEVRGAGVGKPEGV